MPKYNIDKIIERIREEMSFSAGGGAMYRGTGKDDSGSPTGGYDKPLGKRKPTPIGRYGSRKRWLDYVRSSKVKDS